MATDRAILRRQRKSRRVGIAGAAVAALVLLGLSASSASQLAVTTNRLATFSASRCTNTTMSVHVSPTGVVWFDQNKSAVQITNYPAGCNGQTVEVAVSNSTGTLLASGSATCSTSPCVIPTGTYNAMNAADGSVLISTWGVPASWDSVCTLSIFNWRMTCT